MKVSKKERKEILKEQDEIMNEGNFKKSQYSLKNSKGSYFSKSSGKIDSPEIEGNYKKSTSSIKETENTKPIEIPVGELKKRLDRRLTNFLDSLSSKLMKEEDLYKANRLFSKEVGEMRIGLMKQSWIEKEFEWFT